MPTSIPAEAIESATYGLTYKADRIGLRLDRAQAQDLATNALQHVLSSGHVMLAADVAEKVEKEARHTRTALSRAAAAENARDALLVKVQGFTKGIYNVFPALARDMAEALGVMPPE